MFLRYLVLFLGGACLGAVVNLGIYRLAYFRRRISPWCRTRGLPLKRTWFDRIPILGWWSLRREERVHGPGFWVRPMMLELGFGLFVAALYWWELERFAINTWLERPHIHPPGPAIAALHWQFAIHVALLVLMALATFIDIDEQTIPDTITVPGTILALLLAVVCQMPAVPALWVDFNNPQLEDLVAPLTFDWPFHAAAFLDGIYSLIAALAIFLLWCFALLPRRWRLGVKMSKAWRVMWRRIAARPEWLWVLPIAIAGCLVIGAVWLRGGYAWNNLVSSVIGLAVGGGMIWIIRIIAAAVLKREAMGFGDVTLMAMIGAFIGWQAVLIAFFFGAIAGLVVGLTQWLVNRENVIPYGPFLCLGSLTMVLFWAPIWNYFGVFFETPWLVPTAIALCLPPLPILLYGLRWLRERLFGVD